MGSETHTDHPSCHQLLCLTLLTIRLYPAFLDCTYSKFNHFMPSTILKCRQESGRSDGTNGAGGILHLHDCCRNPSLSFLRSYST